jgi:hypothetical protein
MIFKKFSKIKLYSPNNSSFCNNNNLWSRINKFSIQLNKENAIIAKISKGFCIFRKVREQIMDFKLKKKKLVHAFFTKMIIVGHKMLVFSKILEKLQEIYMKMKI